MGLRQGIGGIILLLSGIGLLAYAISGYLDHSISDEFSLGIGISGVIAAGLSIVLFVYNN